MTPTDKKEDRATRLAHALIGHARWELLGTTDQAEKILVARQFLLRWHVNSYISDEETINK